MLANDKGDNICPNNFQFDIPPDYIFSVETPAINYKPLFVATLLALGFHIALAILFSFAYQIYQQQPKKPLTTKTINVELVASSNPNKNDHLEPALIPIKEQFNNARKILTAESTKPQQKPNRSFEEKETLLIESSIKAPRAGKEESTTTEIDIESILNNIEQYIEVNEVPSEGSNEGFVVFDRRVKKQIAERLNQQSRLSQISDMNQARKNDKYFEFKSPNGDQSLRINGNCFTAPAYDPFALVQQIWTTSRGCSKKEELVFKTSLLSHTYK